MQVMMNFEKGAYVISDYENKGPKMSLFASGSEVSLALDVKENLKDSLIYESLIFVAGSYLKCSQNPIEMKLYMILVLKFQ